MLEKIEIIQRFNFKKLNKHYDCFIIDLVRGNAYFNINEMIYPDRFFETNYLASYPWSPILNDLKKRVSSKIHHLDEKSIDYIQKKFADLKLFNDFESESFSYFEKLENVYSCNINLYFSGDYQEYCIKNNISIFKLGTDEELKITRWQRTEMNRRVGIINRRRKARLDELTNLEMKSRGEALGYTRGQLGMGRATEVSLSPMNTFTRRMNRRDLKMKWQVILRESQSEYFTEKDYRLRNNFVKALEQNFNPNDIQEITDNIMNMDIKDFLQKFEEEGGTFEFAYPPNREQYEAYLNAVKTTWLNA